MENKFLTTFDSLISKQTFLEIQQCNEDTLEYGLKLSEDDIKIVVYTRSEALRNNGRVEFDGGVIKKIITAFCDSPYISQFNYLETLDELVDIFYYYKNETMDEIGDEELIDLMKGYFNNSCEGSLELLRDKYLDNIAHDVKYGVKNCMNTNDFGEA